jgi:glycosyltransferase involved in cell wall biosynthesis/SAM-dependent methyltransferase
LAVLKADKAACTIVARNYVAQAKVLARSYLEHATDSHFYLLVVDGIPDGLELDDGITAVSAHELDIDNFTEMSFKYDVTELCTAVKPRLIAHILDKYDVRQLAYLDPDIKIFRPLTEMWRLLSESNIVLIPHLLDPIPLDGKRPSERDILTSGAYNLGFVAVRASEEVDRLLEWWHERLREYCTVDITQGLFVDQKWMDLAPGLFPSTAILYDSTYDVAYWNLHSRQLQHAVDGILVDGRPLAFFHFSGYDPANARALSKHQDRVPVDEGSPLADLLDGYAQALETQGHALLRSWQYGYGAFDNGVAISRVHRRLYAGLSDAQQREFGDPFRAASATSFFRWSLSPQAQADEFSPFLEYVLAESRDARYAFPEARGKQRDAFNQWARIYGALELGYDPRLLDASFPAESQSLSRSSHSGLSPTEGVNVCGYLTNETGIGAVARGFVGALRAAGVPMGLTDVANLSPNRSLDTTLKDIDQTAPYTINLVCVNADQHFVLKSELGQEFFDGHFNIGVWFWELPSFPEEWLNRFEDYDEIWAPSSFIANTLAAVSPIPVVRVPPVLAADHLGSREEGRRRLGAESQTFVFLFIFDFASYVERKNPLGLIRAFKQAFAPQDDVRLVIKCVNEDKDPSAFASMTTLVGSHPISIYNGYWSTQEMRDLMAACDAYASVHRAEGLGLPIADAMALGKPVVATGWSGNTDFMTVSNSFQVPFELVQIRQDVGPYRAGSVWAEPSIDEAARLIREVWLDRDGAAARGQQAKQDLERQFSQRVVGEVVQRRLARASAARRARVAKSPVTTLTSHASAGGAPEVPGLDMTASSHGRLGVFIKQGVNFLLRYHTHYQDEINRDFARFMKQLDAEQQAQKAQFDRLSSYLAERPYMSLDAYGTADLSQPMGFGLDESQSRANAIAPEFSDLFRGTEGFIANRQRVYLQFFKGKSTALDLGCGRGEFLQVLKESGIEAIGVESDPDLVERLRQRGLHVEFGDALDYLAGVAKGSIDVIFSAQFVDHIESPRLATFFELCYERLRDQGLLIAETVNPESYLAMKSFHVDLMRQRPIFPQVLLYLCQRAGFRNGRIFYPTAGGFTQRSYREAGEYAVVAVK